MSESQITSGQVRELREQTGVGVMDCKRALEEASGDMEKAARLLRDRGLASARKRQEKAAEQGVIESYLHIGQQIGSLVEINCETDFVARNSDFLELAHLVALQIAACNPFYIDREAVPAAAVEAERKRFAERCADEGRPESEREDATGEMLEKYYQEACLMEQPFVKEPSVTVGELLTQASAKVGEKLVVRRFIRFQVDEEAEGEDGGEV